MEQKKGAPASAKRGGKIHKTLGKGPLKKSAEKKREETKNNRELKGKIRNLKRKVSPTERKELKKEMGRQKKNW